MYAKWEVEFAHRNRVHLKMDNDIEAQVTTIE